jgi:hypothetical protein
MGLTLSLAYTGLTCGSPYFATLSPAYVHNIYHKTCEPVPGLDPGISIRGPQSLRMYTNLPSGSTQGYAITGSRVWHDVSAAELSTSGLAFRCDGLRWGATGGVRQNCPNDRLVGSPDWTRTSSRLARVRCLPPGA